MKLSLETGSGIFRIDGYDERGVTINGVHHQQTLLVTPTSLSPNLGLGDLTELASEQGHGAEVLREILAMRPEVILIGTGSMVRFPPTEVRRAADAEGLAVDAMDTGAACRTFNILTAEDRRVAALLFMPS